MTEKQQNTNCTQQDGLTRISRGKQPKSRYLLTSPFGGEHLAHCQRNTTTHFNTQKGRGDQHCTATLDSLTSDNLRTPPTEKFSTKNPPKPITINTIRKYFLKEYADMMQLCLENCTSLRNYNACVSCASSHTITLFHRGLGQSFFGVSGQFHTDTRNFESIIK